MLEDEGVQDRIRQAVDFLDPSMAIFIYPVAAAQDNFRFLESNLFESR